MTTTIQTNNLIGTGVQFTFAATGDSFTIVQGVTVGSTTTIAISFGGFSNLLLDIGGTLVSRQFPLLAATPVSTSVLPGAIIAYRQIQEIRPSC